MKPILKHPFPSEFKHKCNVLQPAQEDETLSRHLLNIHLCKYIRLTFSILILIYTDITKISSDVIL